MIHVLLGYPVRKYNAHQKSFQINVTLFLTLTCQKTSKRTTQQPFVMSAILATNILFVVRRGEGGGARRAALLAAALLYHIACCQAGKLACCVWPVCASEKRACAQAPRARPVEIVVSIRIRTMGITIYQTTERKQLPSPSLSPSVVVI